MNSCVIRQELRPTACMLFFASYRAVMHTPISIPVPCPHYPHFSTNTLQTSIFLTGFPLHSGFYVSFSPCSGNSTIWANVLTDQRPALPSRWTILIAGIFSVTAEGWFLFTSKGERGNAKKHYQVIKRKKQWLRLCMLLTSFCSMCFSSYFGFNRERKVFPDHLVLLAWRDSQVLKAHLDHRDPRYISLKCWRILSLPNFFMPLSGLLRTWREFHILADHCK